ncbi:MAG: hypothetical protein M0R00_09055, partial [Candidatus Omnitrophica bacterium]|nr:hypothetical protein [Candidatus Omnitrophota bacterium]
IGGGDRKVSPHGYKTRVVFPCEENALNLDLALPSTSSGNRARSACDMVLYPHRLTFIKPIKTKGGEWAPHIPEKDGYGALW